MHCDAVWSAKSHPLLRPCMRRGPYELILSTALSALNLRPRGCVVRWKCPPRGERPLLPVRAAEAKAAEEHGDESRENAVY